MSPCIYAIRHVASGKQYIGSSVSHRRRWRMHISLLCRGKHHSPHLQRAWTKYGADAFVFEVVAATDLENILAVESEWIARSGCYNAAPVAGTTLGLKLGPHSPEHRAKIGAAQRGKAISPASRLAMSVAKKGKPISEAHREALRKVCAGNVGRAVKDETRRRLSEASRSISDETRAKRSASCRAAMTPERRAAYALAGQNISDETRAKRAESVRRSWVARRARSAATDA
jgi:group I intron endonuclease